MTRQKTPRKTRNNLPQVPPSVANWQAALPEWHAALKALREAHLTRLDVERWERQAVAHARASQASWDAIGTVLGMTGEGARRRYGRDTPGKQ